MKLEAILYITLAFGFLLLIGFALYIKSKRKWETVEQDKGNEFEDMENLVKQTEDILELIENRNNIRKKSHNYTNKT